MWREIVDIYGNKGWIHKSLLKGERYGIINSENKITEVFNYPNGKNIGEIGNNNIVKLKKCLSDWCLIIINRKKGWVNKKNIWGVYKSEIYNVDFFQPLINLSLKFSSIKFFK